MGRSASRFSCATLCLAGLSSVLIGCRHDARLITNGDGVRVVHDIRYAEGVAFDVWNQRRIYLRYEDDVSKVTEGDALYLYLSFRLKQNRDVDWRDPKVFLVWQGASVSFAGFVSDESLEADTTQGFQELSGRFRGTISAEPVGDRHSADLTVHETTVEVVEPTEALQRGIVKKVNQILMLHGANLKPVSAGE